jgi:hypothetical protein
MLTSLFQPAFAQTSSGKLTVSPPKIVIAANPGDTKTVPITVGNLEDKAKTFGVEFRNFQSSDDESGNPKIVDDPSFAQGIQTWLSGPATLFVNSNGSAAYTSNISVPKAAAAGTYYALVLFSPPSENGSIGASVASIVLVNVGNITQQVNIELLSTDGVTIDPAGKFDGDIAVRIKNIGNGYTIPGLKIDILDSAGKIVSSVNANKDNGGILPGTVRKFSIPVPATLDATKSYTARLMVKPEAGKDLTSEKALPRAPAPVKSAPPPKNSLMPIIIIGAIAALLLGALAFVMLKKLRKNKAVTTPVISPLPTIQPTIINNRPIPNAEDKPDINLPHS